MNGRVQKAGGRIKGFLERRWEPLFDTLSIAAGAYNTSDTTFFSVPQGSAAKTKSDTNMVTAGQLPAPQVMRVFGIRAEACLTDATDFGVLKKLSVDSYIRFFVGTKDYLTVPMSAISGKIYMAAGGHMTALVQSFGAPSAKGHVFPKNAFIDILQQENFGVQWVLATAANTLNSALKLRIYLDGYRGLEVR